MEIYCMVNAEGVVVDGDLERVNESMFEFSIVYSGNHLDTLGHPWEIVEVKKIQEMKLLVWVFEEEKKRVIKCIYFFIDFSLFVWIFCIQ